MSQGSGAVLDTATANAAANAAAANPDLSEADKERAQKIASNHALLDRLIAQQSTAAAEQQQALDDLGIIPSAGQQEKRRAPPRRAVTWVNEVRCARRRKAAMHNQKLGTQKNNELCSIMESP